MSSQNGVKRARLSPTDVVFFGEDGSLGQIAAQKFWKDHHEERNIRGVDSFAATFREVASGRAQYGVVPIENSASGTLHSMYDLIVEHDVVICGELGVREVYCLSVPKDEGLGTIRRVLSHPNIIEACSSYLETRLAPASRALNGGGSVEMLPTRSTTEAVRKVAYPVATEPESDGHSAAISTKEAALRHNLTIIAEDIGNDAFLETRYLLFRSRTSTSSLPAPFPDNVGIMRKRSACFALRNEPGSIHRLLGCFAMRNVDVLKVETRPLHSGHRAPPGLPPGTARLWDYLFYVDYCVPPTQTAQQDARLQDSLAEFSLWHRDFGVYPSQTTRVEKQAQSWADMVDIMTKS
mmetsp:Transcript_42663/g.91519  ORF Transcript_42663/g.91519 Transcript_42663/m.91519 type:complete len:351 (+) Transcript_42663:55-1107(+)